MAPRKRNQKSRAVPAPHTDMPPAVQSLLSEAKTRLAAFAKAKSEQDAHHARYNRLYVVAQALKSCLCSDGPFDARGAARLTVDFVRVLQDDGWWEVAMAACAGEDDRQYTGAVLCAADRAGDDREKDDQELVRLLADGVEVGLVGYWLADGLYRELIGLTPAPAQPANAAAELPTIYWLGNRTYRVGESKPIVVHNNYDCLLRAFLNRPVLDLPGLLEHSGLDRDRIMIALGRLKKIFNKLFASAIFCPGVKGQGYRATVIDARLEGKT
jgi:hypothetical protein